MDTNDVIRIYSAASVSDSSLIEDAFSTNGIEYYCSEDLALISGQPAYQFYIRRADAVRAVELLKNLYVADALSDDFDKNQLDTLYEKVVREQSSESEKLSASLLQDLFNILIRPFGRTISFVIVGLIVYFGGIMRPGLESISNVYIIVTPIVTVMVFCIDMYMKNQKKKARTDEMPSEND